MTPASPFYPHPSHDAEACLRAIPFFSYPAICYGCDRLSNSSIKAKTAPSRRVVQADRGQKAPATDFKKLRIGQSLYDFFLTAALIASAFDSDDLTMLRPIV